MKKVKFILTSVLLISLTSLVFAGDDFDPAYMKAFGYGSIFATEKEYPSYTEFNPSLFNGKNGVFSVKHSQDMKLFMRMIFPKGLTPRKCFEKLHKDKPDYMKFFTVD